MVDRSRQFKEYAEGIVSRVVRIHGDIYGVEITLPHAGEATYSEQEARDEVTKMEAEGKTDGPIYEKLKAALPELEKKNKGTGPLPPDWKAPVPIF